MSESSMVSVSLKEHFDRVIEELDKRHCKAMESHVAAVSLAFDAAKEAVAKAEENAERWRLNANEWRGAMTDRERSFIPRLEAAPQGAPGCVFRAAKETVDEGAAKA